MQDSITKKSEVVNAFDNYITQEISREEFVSLIEKFANEEVLKGIELFQTIFKEISNYSEDLSIKEIKQRKLMIESFM